MEKERLQERDLYEALLMGRVRPEEVAEIIRQAHDPEPFQTGRGEETPPREHDTLDTPHKL